MNRDEKPVLYFSSCRKCFTPNFFFSSDFTIENIIINFGHYQNQLKFVCNPSKKKTNKHTLKNPTKHPNKTQDKQAHKNCHNFKNYILPNSCYNQFVYKESFTCNPQKYTANIISIEYFIAFIPTLFQFAEKNKQEHFLTMETFQHSLLVGYENIFFSLKKV